MKLNRKTFFILVALMATTLLSPGLTWAKSTGVRDGGEVVDVSKRKHLRDLVEKSTCTWISGSDFAKKVPKFNEILTSLQKTNWYFAHAISRQLDEVLVCLTGELVPIPRDELSGITLRTYESSGDIDSKSGSTNNSTPPNPKESQYVAIRVNDKIFVDNALLVTLPESEQGQAFVHELLHPLIRRDNDLNWDLRYTYLWSMSKKIYANYLTLMDPIDFAKQMKGNDVILPNNMKDLDADQSFLEKMFSKTATRSEKLVAFQSIKPWVLESLWYKDVSDIFDFVDPIFEKVKIALNENNFTEMQKWITEGLRPEYEYYNDGRESILDLAENISDNRMAVYLTAHLQPSKISQEPQTRTLRKIILGELPKENLDKLFASGVNPNALVNYEFTTMHLTGLAAKFDEMYILKKLLTTDGIEDASVLDAIDQSLRIDRDDESLRKVTFILETKSVSLNQIMPSGSIPFVKASTLRLAKTAKYLLTKGTDPNISINGDARPIFWSLLRARNAQGMTAIVQSKDFVFPELQKNSMDHEEWKWLLLTLASAKESQYVTSLENIYDFDPGTLLLAEQLSKK